MAGVHGVCAQANPDSFRALRFTPLSTLTARRLFVGPANWSIFDSTLRWRDIFSHCPFFQCRFGLLLTLPVVIVLFTPLGPQFKH